MEINTNISNIVEATDVSARYDAEVKKILSNKNILAWIIKYTVSEFKEYTVEEICECIEGEPEVGIRRVMPGKTPEQIIGMDTSDKVIGEGEVTYDIKFFVCVPNGKSIKLIINVEAQNKFEVGYDVVTRSIFYCARMLSSQKNTEFINSNYDDIKKVYSIWICVNVPSDVKNTITRFKMTQENLYGIIKRKMRYDLLETVLIGLGDGLSKGNELHKLLETLLSDKLDVNKKKEILKNKFNIITTIKLEGELINMCNLSLSVLEHGMERGIELGIEKGIEKGIEQGERRFITLLTKLKENKRNDDVDAILTDEKLREKLYKEFGIV